MKIKSRIKKHAQYSELVTQRKWHQVEGSWYQRHWTVWAYTWGLAPYQRCDLHANCSMLEGTSQALNSAFDLKNSITWKIRAICSGLLTNRVSQGSPILLQAQGSPTKRLCVSSVLQSGHGHNLVLSITCNACSYAYNFCECGNCWQFRPLTLMKRLSTNKTPSH